jgi:hypothetical protein
MYSIIKQPKIDLSKKTINPILDKMIKKMDAESFMVNEKDIFVRLEAYKKEKCNS